MGKRVMRQGSDIVAIRCYAPGDGNLSFVASFTEDNPNGKRSQATTPPPTREECEAACPYGWVVYEEGPYFRARVAK